jgi:hypothetical protein
MSETKSEYFFSYRGGKSRRVSKEEWEREWLEWWKKTQADSEAEQGSSKKDSN